MTRATCALVVAALAFACHSSSERPAPPTCTGDCGLDPGLGAGMSPGGGGADGEGEGGSDGGTSKGVLLTGSVLVLNDDVNFVKSLPYAGVTDLKTEAFDGRTVTAQWRGSDPFALVGVRDAARAWVLATPQNLVADDVLAVLESVPTDKPDSQGTVAADLLLVHATSIDSLFDMASVPLTRDPTRSQIILRLVDKTSTAAEPPPLAGINVSATAEATLYGASGGFGTVATATDVTGVVVLANVLGGAYPGALVHLEFSGARTGGSDARAVTGAVTLTTIAL